MIKSIGTLSKLYSISRPNFYEVEFTKGAGGERQLLLSNVLTPKVEDLNNFKNTFFKKIVFLGSLEIRFFRLMYSKEMM